MTTPAKNLLVLCQRHHLILALAESCTGGALAAHLTKIPGASKCFAGSIVSYQDSAKTHLLNVSEELLEQHGAVSVEVANRMLAGALRQFSADIALAVTGVTGPEGGTAKTPIGTIYIALGGSIFQTKTLHFQLEGTREAIIQKAVDKALEQLIQMILDHEFK